MLSATAFAQDTTRTEKAFRLTDLAVELRTDYDNDWLKGSHIDETSGFKCRMLNIKAGGDLSRNFSWFVRWRVNRITKDSNFLDSFDNAYLKFHTHGFELTAGKQPVDVGGWEFDHAPIDLFYLCEPTYHIPCYEWGLRAAYSFNETNGADKIQFQFAQSPFNEIFRDGKEMYGYSLMWYGDHGCWHTASSVSMFETAKGQYNNYIALGNKFEIPGGVTAYVDLTHRYVPGQGKFFFRDFSVIGNVEWRFLDHFKVSANVSYDLNKDMPGDPCIMPGTSMTSVGGGFEYYPLKDFKTIRLHAYCTHSFGTNPNPDGYLLDGKTYLSVGLTWRADFMKLIDKKQHQ